jgi:hypothetical protein
MPQHCQSGSDHADTFIFVASSIRSRGYAASERVDGNQLVARFNQFERI